MVMAFKVLSSDLSVLFFDLIQEVACHYYFKFALVSITFIMGDC